MFSGRARRRSLIVVCADVLLFVVVTFGRRYPHAWDGVNSSARSTLHVIPPSTAKLRIVGLKIRAPLPGVTNSAHLHGF